MLKAYTVPEAWDYPDNILIGYFDNNLDKYAIIYIEQQRAIAIEGERIEEIDWQAPDYLMPPKSIEEIEIKDFE